MCKECDVIAAIHRKKIEDFENIPIVKYSIDDWRGGKVGELLVRGEWGQDHLEVTFIPTIGSISGDRSVVDEEKNEGRFVVVMPKLKGA